MYLRALMILVAAALVAGCSTSARVDNPFASSGPDTTARAEMAAFAATSEYPQGEASDDLRMTVMIDRDGEGITLVNPTDRNITDARLWINGQFVARVDNLPANGTITLNRAHFYDRSGTSLSAARTSANSVQLQTQDGFYNVLGPVFY